MKAEKDAPVMVDTSVWVEFFNRPGNKIAHHVKILLERDKVCLAGVVLTEILQGVKGPEERKTLTETLSILPFIETDREDWIAAGWRLNELRAQGVTVPVTDAILAQLCLRYGIEIFTLDKHFDHFHDLRRYKPA